MTSRAKVNPALLEKKLVRNLGEPDRFSGYTRRKEAPPGFEPGMVDLQSTALATWPRRLVSVMLDSVIHTDKID